MAQASLRMNLVCCTIHCPHLTCNSNADGRTIISPFILTMTRFPGRLNSTQNLPAEQQDGLSGNKSLWHIISWQCIDNPEGRTSTGNWIPVVNDVPGIWHTGLIIGGKCMVSNIRTTKRDNLHITPSCLGVLLVSSSWLAMPFGK